MNRAALVFAALLAVLLPLSLLAGRVWIDPFAEGEGTANFVIAFDERKFYKSFSSFFGLSSISYTKKKNRGENERI